MDTQKLRKVAQQLVENGKGILAIDESPPSIEKKFASQKINNTPENRRKFRQALLQTEEIEKYISGAILHTETFFQRTDSDMAFYDLLRKKNILTGIKLDQGLVQIDYEDVKIKASKTARMINEKIPPELKEGVAQAGTKIKLFFKKRPEQEPTEIKSEEKHGEFVKFCSSENFDEPYIEIVPKGIEDLKEKLESGMFGMAQFAKWRSLFTISRCTPTFECIDRNCEILAQYALLCQEHNLVPIVEPEILFDGTFSIEEHYRIFKYILSLLMNKLNFKNVDLNAIIFKIGFVTAGKEKSKVNAEEVSKFTDDVISSVLPAKIPGIVFLSGGHTQEDSIKYLKTLCDSHKSKNLTFSFGRALTNNALQVWNGKEENEEKMQKIFLEDCLKMSNASKQ